MPKPVANPVTGVTEKIPGSDLSAEIIYVEMNDGTHSPIAMMKPAGNGRFPLETSRQGRQLFNRGPLEYDDAIAIVKFAKTLPYVNPDRIGYLGLSHGGEMAFKIGSEYDGLRCMISVEPAAGEYLGVGRRPAGSLQIPETRMNVTQQMMDQELADTRARTNMTVAMERINRIKTPILVMGRINDNNEPQFRLAYELAKEAGKQVEWKQYEHPEHGFIFVTRNAKGVYEPDPAQRQIVADTIGYFNSCLK